MQTQIASSELYLGPCYIKQRYRVAVSENQCRKLQGATEGIPLSGKGTTMLAWEELHLDLPAPRWLPGQWVFQSVDLAKHLTVTSLGWDHPIFFSPWGRSALATPRLQDPVAGGRETTPISCQVCFTGIVSAVKTPPAKTRLYAQSIIQGLLYQPSANLLLSWEKSKGPGQQTVC